MNFAYVCISMARMQTFPLTTILKKEKLYESETNFMNGSAMWDFSER
jgi:hypothetical protein